MDDELFRLSPSQELVWFHEQMSPGSRAYNFAAVLELRGELDEDALLGSLAQVLGRHDALRLELAGNDADGRSLQRIRARCEPRYRVADLQGAGDPETAFQEVLQDEARTPIDTSRAPLLRWCLVRMAPGLSRLVHVEHHLVHDGHSFVIILRDLFSLYQARLRSDAAALPAPGSYADYLRSAADGAGAHRERKLDFWHRELSGADFELRLPGLSRPGAMRAFTGGQLRQRIDPVLAEALRELSRSHGHTVFTMMLGLFGELLRRHGGRTDVVIGSAVGNRPPGAGETAGMFVNTIPLWLRLDPDAPATAAMDEATETLLRVLPYQDVPLQELTRSFGLRTTGADNPLFSVMFSAHDAPLPEVLTPGLEVSLHEGVNTGTTRFDLDVVLLPDDRRSVGSRHGPAGMLLIWDYSDTLFGIETIELLAERLVALARDYVSQPATPLCALGQARMRADLVPSGTPLPPGQALGTGVAGLAALLTAIRAHDPDALAFLSGTTRLSYGELDRRVASLTGRLAAAGVRPGHLVAVMLPRGAHTVTALLACLGMGAVYCPLPAHDPARRLASILAGLAPALVLASEETVSYLPGTGLPVARIDDEAFPATVPGRRIDGAAYVIHTSGSTGAPRPVVISRTALAHHVVTIGAVYGLTPADRALVFAQPSFDVALEEILPPLVQGASLVTTAQAILTGAELAAILAAYRVTVANLPTSYLIAFAADFREALSDGQWRPRLLIIGGERIPAAALRGIADATTATVLNAYGVTEATITSAVHQVGAADLVEGADIPLGRELPGVRVHILDPALQPLPDGAVGEIAIAGAVLATGYLGDQAATDSRFPALSALAGERVYLTGDIGYRDTGGLLWFVGRRDNQVKLRGYRIELEEAEFAASAVLGGHPCAVVLDEHEPGSPRLVGFLAGSTEPDLDAFQVALAQRLPPSMLPGAWIRLDSLPVLAGGKPDRRALARLAAAPRAPASAPVGACADGDDEILELVSAGWRHVLGHGQFTPASNFFQVGGHSLTAAQLAAWLEPRLGSRPRLRILFQHPVLNDLARVLTNKARE